MFLYISQSSFSSKCLVIELIPTHIFYKPSTTSSFITFSRTESEMFFICLRCSDESGVTVRISTVFTVICGLICIETLPYSCMCIFISDLCRNSSIKSIEISEPISIIELIHIFYHTSLDRVKLRTTELIPQYCSLLTADTASTIPDYFLSLRLFTILF